MQIEILVCTAFSTFFATIFKEKLHALLLLINLQDMVCPPRYVKQFPKSLISSIPKWLLIVKYRKCQWEDLNMLCISILCYVFM